MIGFGLNIANRVMGGVDAQAQAHYNRVIADGGVVPAGVSGTNAFFTAVKTIYGTSDITTAVSVGLDAHYLGYKLGAGAGATSGQAVQKLYSCAGSSGDVVQTTAASQPLLLVHSGANYWWGSGVNGNYCQTTTNNAFQFNSDFSIQISGVFTSGIILSKYAGSDYVELSQNSGNIRLTYFNGSTFPLNINFGAISTTALTYLKLSRSGNDYTLLQSSDNINFTTVGSSTNAASIPSISSPLYISNGGAWAGNGLAKIFNSNFYNDSTFTTLIATFNPSQYNAATSQTQWTSTTGEVWTINTGTDATGYKGVLVDRTEVQGDGIDDKLNSGVLSSVSTFSRYVAMNPFQRTGFGVLVSGDNSLNTALYKDSSAIRIYNGGAGVGALSFTSPESHLLALFTADYNTSNSKATINNGTDATGIIGDNASTAINVFSDNTYAGNGMISTIISCRTVNNTSQKTAMYNYIKSINNNAF
jgi:hypothetical protein